ncbi:uncharacterized protein [Dermacentor andersoni]|uniref:uncharacterized protein n=1 Tax=Dermacentor andersoni TaxID=34620 RepID=UPI002416ADDE|nr:uncharacterized protein LOC126534104 [Dermacentor andersoni]
MKTSAGRRASGAAGPTSGEAEAEGASATSGSGSGKSGTAKGATGPRGGKPPSDKVIKSALRVLKLRLDRVGRKLSELDFDNRALMGRVQFFRSENCKLHQALEKERTKARNSPDRTAGGPAGTSFGGACAQGGATSGSPTNASSSAAALLDGERVSPTGANVTAISSTVIEQEPWPLSPSTPGRSSLLTDMMTPSTSSASLDAILSHRRQLRRLPQEPQEQHAVIALASTAATPISPPRLALPPPIPSTLPVFTFGQTQRSNTSFQDVSEDPIFLFTDLFEDTSDESVNNNLGISRQGPGLVSSSVTVQNAASTDTVPSTSIAAKPFSSNTTVASDVASTSRDQQLDQPEKQDRQDRQDQHDPREQHDRKEQPDQREPNDQQQLQDQQVSSTTSDPNSESKGTRSRSPLPDEPDLYEPKYSMSSSSLD